MAGARGRLRVVVESVVLAHPSSGACPCGARVRCLGDRDGAARSSSLRRSAAGVLGRSSFTPCADTRDRRAFWQSSTHGKETRDDHAGPLNRYASLVSRSARAALSPHSPSPPGPSAPDTAATPQAPQPVTQSRPVASPNRPVTPPLPTARRAVIPAPPAEAKVVVQYAPRDAHAIATPEVVVSPTLVRISDSASRGIAGRRPPG